MMGVLMEAGGVSNNIDGTTPIWQSIGDINGSSWNPMCIAIYLPDIPSSWYRGLDLSESEIERCVRVCSCVCVCMCVCVFAK